MDLWDLLLDSYVFYIAIIMLPLIAIGLLRGGLDRRRIRAHIVARDGHICSLKLAIKSDTTRETSERVYNVRYWDRGGTLHEAVCHTALSAGVRMTQDRTVSETEQRRLAGGPQALDGGNRRQRNERIKRVPRVAGSSTPAAPQRQRGPGDAP